MDVPSLLDQLPVAEASWLLWHDVLPEQALQAIYDTYRGASYQRCFSFRQLVHLVNDALTRHQGRAHKTLARHADSFSTARPSSTQPSASSPCGNAPAGPWAARPWSPSSRPPA